MKNKPHSNLENNLNLKKEKLFFLPRLVLSSALTMTGAYISYLSYNSDNKEVDFLGTVFLSAGLISLGGLIYPNFEKLRDKIKTLKVGYRLRRLLIGESGIVEKVEEYPIDDKPISDIEPLKDRFGNLPQKVFFKTPLEELKDGYSLEERIALDNEIGFAFRYKTYKTGDKFP